MAGLVIDRYRTASRLPLPELAIPA
jgi:hypothetical protein